MRKIFLMNFLYFRILTLIFTLSLYLIIPISIILVWIPIILVRKVITILKRFFRPDLVKILNSRSALLAVDQLDNQPHSTLLTSFDLEGSFNLKKYQESFCDKVLEARHPNGNFIYPELTQYYSNWLGFSFWKKDEHFDISNHIKYLDMPQSLTDECKLNEDIKHLKTMKYIEKFPYASNRSPWELLIIRSNPFDPNERREEQRKTRVILRWHHGLCDGYSILNIIISWCKNKPIQKFPKRHSSKMIKMMRNLLAGFVAPYHISNQLINSFDRNLWHLPEKELSKEWNVAMSSNISVNLIKQIRKNAGVGFTPVLIGAIGQGLKKFWINNLQFDSEIHAVLGLPWPNRPHKMCNNWTFGYVQLPTKEKSFIEATKVCEKRYRTLKSSLIPISNYGFLFFIGLLPNCLIIHCKNVVATSIISIVPGPEEPMLFLDGEWELEMKNIFFWGGLTRGNAGIGIFIFSYNGNIKIVLSVDSEIISEQEKIDELLEQIVQELENFNYICNYDV